MTTIVEHRRTKKQYILLSINGEVAQANPSRFISEFFNQEKSEVSCSATVCDVQGNIFLADIDDLIVTEINGKKPGEILPEPTYESVNYESVDNDTYQPQTTEYEEDEEFEDDNEESDPDPAINPKTSFMDGLGTPMKDDVNDDDDDWI
ncbi:MAG: hypothetical protein AAF383_05185 [Cyanobacteria bacterium P01_A01_bin.83]